jgi:hypothetical protein
MMAMLRKDGMAILLWKSGRAPCARAKAEGQARDHGAAASCPILQVCDAIRSQIGVELMAAKVFSVLRA